MCYVVHMRTFSCEVLTEYNRIIFHGQTLKKSTLDVVVIHTERYILKPSLNANENRFVGQL